MNVALWIIAALLAAAFLAAGAVKRSRPMRKPAGSGMIRAEYVLEGTAQTIGAPEVLGARGVFRPPRSWPGAVSVPHAF